MGATCLVIPLPRHTVLLDIGSTHPNGTVPLLGGGFRHVGKSGLGPGSRFKASVCSIHSGSLLIEHKLDTCNTISDTICLLDDDGTYQRTTEESQIAIEWSKNSMPVPVIERMRFAQGRMAAVVWPPVTFVPA